MPIDKIEFISEHSQFYRNGFRMLVTTAIVLTVIAFLLLGLIFYQHFTRPTVKYFVTTSDGRLIEIAPLP